MNIFAIDGSHYIRKSMLAGDVIEQISIGFIFFTNILKKPINATKIALDDLL
jgi:hypothetical protein